MNVLSWSKREELIRLLVEGNSISGTARIADVAFNSVLRFVPLIGRACLDYQDQALMNLPCKRIQIDEIWTFCHTHPRNVIPERKGQLAYGDLWTFVAIDPDTKLVPSWVVGKRNLYMARLFLADLKMRLKNRIQLSSDGWQPYKRAVEDTFGLDVDYGMVVKIYDNDDTDPETLRLHALPGIQPHCIFGRPDPKHVSTSLIERQNVTMRQSMRRFVRKSNGHSKKPENHMHAVSLHYMHYNFCRIHQTLRITPAMAAGVTDRVWSHSDVVEILEKFEVVNKGKVL